MLKRITRSLVGLAVFAAVWSASSGSAAPASPTITGARVGAHPNLTRFVLESDRSFPYRVFVLRDPYRVVIDLPEVVWRVPARKTAATGLIQRFRYGLFRPGNSRVVIDAKGPVAIEKAFFLPPGKTGGRRFVVDLRAVTEKEFDSARRTLESADWARMTPRPSRPRAARATPPQRRADTRRVVMIDPGHGGVDPGAIGLTGVFEKYITLETAREVKRLMESTGRYRVLLTRTRDIYVSLRKRFELAEDAGAELFISLHADTIRNRKVRGASVYTLSEKASDREAEALAAKENRADIIAGVDLTAQSDDVASILISLRQRNTMDESAYFAAFLVKELGRQVRLLRNTHRFAGFAVLKSPDVPSVLVELGYLSNRKDERLLRSREFRRRVARAILRAADRYFARKDRLSRS